ncbi:MAG: hypothetical protein HOI95_18850 [Chromatiales bacterium]|jgi:hypothetical protein|nr:hypothetical protein [Chromatiales bacterium]
MQREKEPSVPAEPAIDAGGQDAGSIDLAGVARRGQSLDVGGAVEPQPGDPVSHLSADFANVLASNIFLSGLDPAFAAEHLGYFTAPYADRRHVTGYDVERYAMDASVQSLHRALAKLMQVVPARYASCTPLRVMAPFAWRPGGQHRGVSRPRCCHTRTRTASWPHNAATLCKNSPARIERYGRASAP